MHSICPRCQKRQIPGPTGRCANLGCRHPLPIPVLTVPPAPKGQDRPASKVPPLATLPYWQRLLISGLVFAGIFWLGTTIWKPKPPPSPIPYAEFRAWLDGTRARSNAINKASQDSRTAHWSNLRRATYNSIVRENADDLRWLDAELQRLADHPPYPASLPPSWRERMRRIDGQLGLMGYMLGLNP
jgi:hypothetical protein